MLEIFIVDYLLHIVGADAKKKGLSVSRWKAYTLFTWIGLELAGICMSLFLFGELTVAGLLIAYLLPILGNVLLRQNLKKYPDLLEDNLFGPDSLELLPIIVY
ncbi:hypothetical protein [Taibaiella soli]|uniref:Uncharacterized protein n=1 Tax=Taibaiella soli TaxID=1649169 RepID=A0A2W2A7K5_9BACT|nr:hypothetical protein [Taibaiella soli]PZF71315.1 hypothetical protein DN068_18640 [Taibaiella soli]